jgi:hypothetical protein
MKIKPFEIVKADTWDIAKDDKYRVFDIDLNNKERFPEPLEDGIYGYAWVDLVNNKVKGAWFKIQEGKII